MMGTVSATLLSGAWRALSWRKAGSVAALALLWSLVMTATQSDYFSEGVLLTPVLNGVITMQLNGFAVLFAVLVADEASTPSRPRWWPYAVAVPVGVVIGSSLVWLVSQRILGLASAYQLQGAIDGFGSFFFRHASHALVICGMVALLYAIQRRGAQRAARLRDTQRDHAEAQRRVVEARLSAVRARLEPEFLLRTLADIDALYQRDVGVADHVLRELTAYLRATIPEMREPSSTVATEIRLASAFLNVSALRASERLRLTAGEALARQARMPPMVLLPLAQYALGDDAEATLGLELARAGDGVVLTIRDKKQSFAPCNAEAAVIREVRERLYQLHGAHGRLTLQDDAPGSAVAIEFPLATTGVSTPAVAEEVAP
jgi:hypothetical protein